MEKPTVRWGKWRKEQLERCLREQKDMEYTTKLLGVDEADIQAYLNSSTGNVVNLSEIKGGKLKAQTTPLEGEKATASANSLNPAITNHLIKLLEKIIFYQEKIVEIDAKLENEKLPVTEQFRLDFLMRYYSVHRDHYEEQYEQIMDTTVLDFYNRETIK